MISKSLSTSEKRAALHEEAGPLAEFCQALYPLMVAHADDWGCMQGDAFTVKHLVDPTSPRPVSEFALALAHMHNVGLIAWYEADDKQIVSIRGFAAHQSLRGHDKDGRTRPFPAPSENISKIDVFAQKRPTPPKSALREEKRTEEKRTELNGREESNVAPLRPRAVYGPGAGAGSNPRDHLQCRPPCIRVCVSQKQHAILRERHGGTDADMDAFYADVRAQLSGPVGMRPWEFWESQFIARFGGTVDKRTAGNEAAKARFLAGGVK